MEYNIRETLFVIRMEKLKRRLGFALVCTGGSYHLGIFFHCHKGGPERSPSIIASHLHGWVSSFWEYFLQVWLIFSDIQLLKNGIPVQWEFTSIWSFL
jgi:hypothetical protein